MADITSVSTMKRALKETEVKLVAELMKNSRRSDRELATLLEVSQPTVSRIRQRLEKEGMIDYTGIPDLARLGYGIIAVVLGKRDFAKHPENLIEIARDFVGKHPNIIFCSSGEGLNYDVISISIHKDYSDYSKFISEAVFQGGQAVRAESFLIDTSSERIVRHLSLKPFAEYMIKKKG